MVSDKQAKLGQINFVNSLPVTYPLVHNMVRLNANLHLGNPAELNCAYAESRLDLGAMSTFFYLENGGLNLFANLSISSQGPVGSVLFFSKVDLSSRKNLKVTASSASATSINLLSVLLREDFEIVPSFNYSPRPDLSADDVDAVLVIGDHALDVDDQWAKLAQRIDLGQWWSSKFNLPMVFAVWAARSPWLAQHSSQCREIAQSLEEALSLGLGEGFDQVVDVAVNRTGLAAKRIERYFRQELDFSFSPEHLAGLNRYKSLCEKHGLLVLCAPDRQASWLPVN